MRRKLCEAEDTVRITVSVPESLSDLLVLKARERKSLGYSVAEYVRDTLVEVTGWTSEEDGTEKVWSTQIHVFSAAEILVRAKSEDEAEGIADRLYRKGRIKVQVQDWDFDGGGLVDPEHIEGARIYTAADVPADEAGDNTD